jgi:hypothetical protein
MNIIITIIIIIVIGVIKLLLFTSKSFSFANDTVEHEK